MKFITITFKHKERILYDTHSNLTIEGVENAKTLLSFLHKVDKDSIEVETEINELSEYDVSNLGMYKWTDTFPKKIKGVRLMLVEGSNEHLDAISKGTLENYLELY